VAWTIPKTWSAVVVTVADLNQQIRDNLNILKTCIDNNGHLAYQATTVTYTSAAYPTYQILVSDDVILADATLGAITIMLPFSSVKKRYEVKKIDSSANGVTVVQSLSDPTALIDGEASYLLDTQYRSVTLQCVLAQWYIL